MRYALAVLFVLAAVPARAQCPTSADVPVSTPAFVPTGGYAVSAVVANDNGAFGVWRRTHAGFAMITNFVDGAVMNAEAAPVAATERSVSYGAMVAVATDGHDYLLATSDRGNISAKIIDATGEDRSAPIVISAESSASSATGPIDATWNGREYVIAATLNKGGSTQLQLAAVSAGGELLETAAANLGTSALAVVPAGDGRALVAFRDNDSVRIAFADGVHVAGTSTSISGIAADAGVSLATNGNYYLLAWRDTGAFAQRLNGHGIPVEPIMTLAASNPTDDRTIRVVREGSGYLVLWSAPWTTAQRIDANGLAGAPFQAAGDALSSAASARDGTIIIGSTPCGSMRSTFLPAGAREPGATNDVSTRAMPPAAPVLATVSRGRVAVWKESAPENACGADPSLVAKFLRNDGTQFEDSLSAPGAFAGGYTAVSLNDSTVIVWDEYPGGSTPGVIRVVALDANGSRVSASVLASPRFAFALNAVASGASVLVTWEQEREGISIFDVYAAVLSPTGSVVVPPTRLSDDSDSALWLIAASDGNRSVVSWLNNARDIVSVETDASLRIVRRATLPWTGDIQAFQSAAARNGNFVLIAPSFDADGARVVAIDPFSGRTSSLTMPTRENFVAQVRPDSDGFVVYLATGDSNSMISRVRLTADLNFGTLEPLTCVDALPLAIGWSFDQRGLAALAYSAHDRVFIRAFGPRRRAVSR